MATESNGSANDLLRLVEMVPAVEEVGLSHEAKVDALGGDLTPDDDLHVEPVLVVLVPFDPDGLLVAGRQEFVARQNAIVGGCKGMAPCVSDLSLGAERTLPPLSVLYAVDQKPGLASSAGCKRVAIGLEGQSEGERPRPHEATVDKGHALARGQPVQ